MCIRDRPTATDNVEIVLNLPANAAEPTVPTFSPTDPDSYSCLLYTSDAADERSSVDLGGRRIIKKKKTINTERRRLHRPENTTERLIKIVNEQ